MGSVAACIITLVLGFLHVLGAESTFAVQVFWSDPACTQYAGTFSTALNGCFAEFDSDTQQISYVILNTTNTNGIYNMKAYHYTDSICSEFIDSTSMNFPGSCTAYGSGGYTTLVMTTSMPTEFPVDGSFST